MSLYDNIEVDNSQNTDNSEENTTQSSSQSSGHSSHHSHHHHHHHHGHGKKHKRYRSRRSRKKQRIKRIIVGILVALLAAVVIILIGFQSKKTIIKSDRNQYTEEELQAYADTIEIDNTFFFWLKNVMGEKHNLDLFSEYTVKLSSPGTVIIEGKEKILYGYVHPDERYIYMDDTGNVLKISTDLLDNVTLIEGIDIDGDVRLYSNLPADEDKLDAATRVLSALAGYKYSVEKIEITDDYEIIMYIKNLKVLLGRNKDLDKKIYDFNDMYYDVIDMSGTLDMQKVSEDGEYTMTQE